VISVDPVADELAIVAIQATKRGEDVVMGLLQRPGGMSVAVIHGSQDGLEALAEAILGALRLLEVAPEGSVDYVARIGEPRP
jgi:hypothetical protein